jgi:lipopolysaccharide/colanic/teichoic acid biosynthesis glycosyltransferase
MSLVGPRPEMPQIVKEYNAVQRERFLVVPGMTGLWQISADRNLPIHENTDYDLYYIYNQSLLLDVVILTRTAVAMFSGH